MGGHAVADTRRAGHSCRAWGHYGAFAGVPPSVGPGAAAGPALLGRAGVLCLGKQALAAKPVWHFGVCRAGAAVLGGIGVSGGGRGPRRLVDLFSPLASSWLCCPGG